MSFLAADTLIAVPGGFTSISKLKIGEIVLAWTPSGIIEQSVIFTDGVKDSRIPLAVYIRTKNSELILGAEQKMLLDDQTLKRADQLVPLKDRLFRSDSRSEEIQQITCGEYRGGAYHVAIDGNDNLIIAAGFVCGDFKKIMEG